MKYTQETAGASEVGRKTSRRQSERLWSLSTAAQHRNYHSHFADPKPELREVKPLPEVTQQGSGRAGISMEGILTPEPEET